MGFMQPEVCHDDWYVIETRYGTQIVPAYLVGSDPTPAEMGPFVEGGAKAIESIEGPRTAWGARLSAPGYLDSTDWSLHDTEEQARGALADEFPEEDEEDEGD